MVKLTYSADPFNIPEKLYAYFKTNNIKVETYEAQEFVSEVLSEVPYGKSYADLTKIPQGVDKKVRTELTDLLSAFCIDPENGSLEMKKQILYDLGEIAVERMEKEYAEHRRMNSLPPNSNSNSNNSNIINLRRFGVTGNSSSNEEIYKPAVTTVVRRGPIPPPPVAVARRGPVPSSHADFRSRLNETLRRQRKAEISPNVLLRQAEAKALKELTKKGGKRKTMRRRVQNRRK